MPDGLHDNHLSDQPLYIENPRQNSHERAIFTKAFQDSIERHLKKPLLPPSLITALPVTKKPTLILSLDGCLLDASIQEA